MPTVTRTPWVTSSAVTLPFGIKDPVGSVIVPLRLPESPTPWAYSTGIVASKHIASTKIATNEIIPLMAPPPALRSSLRETSRGRLFVVLAMHGHPQPLFLTNCERRYHIRVTNVNTKTDGGH